MKKWLVGCGVMLLLGGLTLGGMMWWGFRFAKNLAGELMTATELLARTPVDRLEQDAEDVMADDFAKRLPELNSRFVRVKGVVADKKVETQGQPPVEGVQTNAMIFLEPPVMVLGVADAFSPKEFPPGSVVEVLGVASRLNLSAIPGANDEMRKQWRELFGSDQEAPVVVAKRVKHVVTPKKTEPAATPDAGGK
ncbi:MAG: hypothetical protein AB2A00_31570 [Myxococcota bacterium]